MVAARFESGDLIIFLEAGRMDLVWWWVCMRGGGVANVRIHKKTTRTQMEGGRKRGRVRPGQMEEGGLVVSRKKAGLVLGFGRRLVVRRRYGSR